MPTGTRTFATLAGGTISGALTDVGTTITFATGAEYPDTLATGEYALLTIGPAAALGDPTRYDELEVVALVGPYVAGASTGTIERAAEGTTGIAHSDGDVWIAGGYASDFDRISGGARHARVYRSTTQSIPHNTTTPIELDSTTADADGLHDPGGANPERLLLNKRGLWLIVGQIEFTYNATGFRGAHLSFTGVVGNPNAITRHSVPASADNLIQVSAIVEVDDPDAAYATLDALQNSGGALNTVAGEDRTWLSAAHISGADTAAVSLTGAKATIDAFATPAMTADTDTAVDWDTVAYDSHGFLDVGGANPSRFTVPSGQGGKYHFSGSVCMFPTSSALLQARVYVNGTSVHQFTQTTAGGSYVALAFAADLDLSPGDYVEVKARTNLGTTTELIDDDIWTFASLHRLGQAVVNVETQEVEGGLHLIEEIELSASAASITFDSIPPGYDDLKLVASLRTDRAGAATDGVDIRVGQGTVDAGTNYALSYDGYNGADADFVGGGLDAMSAPGGAAAATAAANKYGHVAVLLQEYASTGRFRSASVTSGVPGENAIFSAVTDWNNTTDPIDILTLLPVTGANFVAGSKARLYGVKARNGQVNVAFTGAKGGRTSSQSLTNGVGAALTIQTTEWDSHGFWNASTPSRLTVPAGQGGKYQFEGVIWLDAAVTTPNVVIRKNGTVVQYADLLSGAGNNARSIQFSRVMDLVPGDYVDVVVTVYEAGRSILATYTTATLTRLGQALPPSDQPAGTLLDLVQYDPASLTRKEPTTLTALDTTNLRTTFVAPASGRVLVRLNATTELSNGATLDWALLDGGSAVTDSQQRVGYNMDGTNAIQLRGQYVRMFEVTPGVTYTWDWAAIGSSATNADTVYGLWAGAAVMEVLAA